ncbi:hypothetical protein SUGI_1178120 [Cryptomeria japonica]|uniref:monooxygenase 2 n=1 Tax=Cryptomeria japonica TaxID=3369 RepID=UPI002414C6DF|nr:monooxygenase 2 [Cryptomeria japonica]GLJ54859.1 hypothetical protein SUGI_1178120 [Cryptomeria japonica]
METEFEGFVIAGAGIAGLATALALHRVGIKSLVLEQAESLRATGGGLGVWTNAWKALTALGIADQLREQHPVLLQSFELISLDQGMTRNFSIQASDSGHELRCVKRAALLEALATALPPDTIKYNCKVLRVRQSLSSKYSSETELEDGTVIRAKGVIGCDGVRSVVSQGFLGLPAPTSAGRCGIRGLATYADGHGASPSLQMHFLNGVTFGRMPVNDKELFWFIVRNPPPQDYAEISHDPLRIREFSSSLLKDFPSQIKDVIGLTATDSLNMAVLRFKWPWDILNNSAYKGSVTAAGDAVHPMTPDLAQGGNSALEDAIVLARCLAETLNGRSNADNEGQIVEKALKKYVDEMKWRWVWLVSQAYITGVVQQGSSRFIRFIRDNIALKFRSPKDMFIHATYDCGTLPTVNPI